MSSFKKKKFLIHFSDPFSTKRNIARSVSGGKIFEYFQDCLVKTCLYFGFPCHQANGKTNSSNYKNKSVSDEIDTSTLTAKCNSNVTTPQPLKCNRNKEGTVVNSKETNSVKLNQDEQLESINDFHEPSGEESGSGQTSYATLQCENDGTLTVAKALKDVAISEKSNSQKNFVQNQKSLHADQDSAGPLHYIFSKENLSDGKVNTLFIFLLVIEVYYGGCFNLRWNWNKPIFHLNFKGGKNRNTTWFLSNLLPFFEEESSKILMIILYRDIMGGGISNIKNQCYIYETLIVSIHKGIENCTYYIHSIYNLFT